MNTITSNTNVILDEHDLKSAKEWADRIQELVKKNGCKNAYGLGELSDDENLKKSVDGGLAEIAYCKAIGVSWPATVGKPKCADAGTKVQIRGTPYCSGRLIVRPDANDDDVYALVIGEYPNYRVVGEILAKDAKQNKWLTDPTPEKNRPRAYFVPQIALLPPGSLYR